MNLPPLPEWMPPLPVEYGTVTYTAEQVFAFAEIAVEAYKASLKPVAWMFVDDTGMKWVETWPSDEVQTKLIPLYWLD